MYVWSLSSLLDPSRRIGTDFHSAVPHRANFGNRAANLRHRVSLHSALVSPRAVCTDILSFPRRIDRGWSISIFFFFFLLEIFFSTLEFFENRFEEGDNGGVVEWYSEGVRRYFDHPRSADVYSEGSAASIFERQGARIFSFLRVCRLFVSLCRCGSRFHGSKEGIDFVYY